MAPSSQPSFEAVGYIILFVRDMSASVAFFRTALAIAPTVESPEWTELATKGTTIALHHTDEPRGPGRADLPNVVLAVDDVRAADALLRERGVKVTELKVVWESPEVTGLSCNFKDPDGNMLSIHGTVPTGEWKGAR